MGIGLETVVKRSQDIAHIELADEAIMLDAASDSYYELNPVAARIWALAADEVALATVVDMVRREFEIDEDNCVSDVLAFAGELVDAGVLEIVSTNADAGDRR